MAITKLGFVANDTMNLQTQSFNCALWISKTCRMGQFSKIISYPL